MTRYYAVPFADVGDKLDIPDAIQPSGSVSYEQGYGSDYSLSLAGGPPAKAYPRNQSNQFAFDITENAQKFQQFGAPEFIPSMDNAPGTFSYAKGVIVRYDAGSGFNFYQSLANANTALPTDSTKWRLLDAAQDLLVYYTSNFGTGVVTGDIVTFSGVTGQFEKAIAGSSILENALGVANIENNYIQLVGVCGGFSGLTPGAVYYLSSITAGGISLTTVSGITIVIVGYAISTTELALTIQKEMGTDQDIKFGTVAFNAATTQVIGIGSHTVQFNNIISDTNGWWNAGLFAWQPTVAGYYRVTTAVSFVFPSQGDAPQTVVINKNGVLLNYSGSSSGLGGSLGVTNGVSPPIFMNGSTDYLQLIWDNEATGGVTIGAIGGANGDKSFFTIEYLGQ